MANAKRGVILGLLGGGVYFLFSFAKTVLVVPSILSHWGVDVFNFWLILNSSKIFFQFLPEGFTRYVANGYNIKYHLDKSGAATEMSASLSFLLVTYAFVIPTIFLAFVCVPGVTAFFFNTDVNTAAMYNIGWSVLIYFTATSIQNITRLNYVKKEPLGRTWENLVLESSLLAVEIAVILALVALNYSYIEVVVADSIVIAVFSFYYYLRTNVTTHSTHVALKRQSLKKGVKLFSKSSLFNVSNFFDKLTNESFILLLSFFKFSPIAVTFFSTVRTITNAPVSANNILSNAMLPEIQKNFSKQDSGKIRQIFQFAWFFIGTLMCVVITALYPIYDDVYLLLTKGKIEFSNWFFTLILIDTLIMLYSGILLLFIKGVNKIRRILTVSVIRAVLIIVLIAILPKQLFFIAYIMIAVDMVASLGLYTYHANRLLQKAGQGNLRLLLSGFVPYSIAIVFLLIMSAAGFNALILIGYMAATLISVILVCKLNGFDMWPQAKQLLNRVYKR